MHVFIILFVCLAVSPKIKTRENKDLFGFSAPQLVRSSVRFPHRYSETTRVP